MNLIERLRIAGLTGVEPDAPDSITLKAANEIERLTAERDALRKAVIGLLLTDPSGARADWPEYIAARAAIDAARKA